MAVTPEQALALNEQEQGTLVEWEAVVDAELRQRFTGNNLVVIGGGGLPSRLLPHLITRYTAVGWSVDQRDNQRDGFSLEFSRARHA